MPSEKSLKAASEVEQERDREDSQARHGQSEERASSQVGRTLSARTQETTPPSSSDETDVEIRLSS